MRPLPNRSFLRVMSRVSFSSLLRVFVLWSNKGRTMSNPNTEKFRTKLNKKMKEQTLMLYFLQPELMERGKCPKN